MILRLCCPNDSTASITKPERVTSSHPRLSVFFLHISYCNFLNLKMLLLYILVLCLVISSHQQGSPSDFPGKITCCDFEGTPYNNNTQCSGSCVCCQTSDQCNPNRLCDDPHGSLIRPTCSHFPRTNCSPLCLLGKLHLWLATK